MRLTNRWNRFVYRLWAPVYDGTVNTFFRPGRKRAMDTAGFTTRGNSPAGGNWNRRGPATASGRCAGGREST